MNSIFGEACNSCDALPLCRLRVERLEQIEARAKHAGTLVLEGRVVCELGPGRFIREGHEINPCRADPTMPVVSDLELAEEIAEVWPNAPLQPVRE